MQRLLAGTAVPLALALCACGGGGGGTPSAPTTTGGGGSQSAFTITIQRQNGSQSFSPNPALAGGLTVVFRNADSVVHRVQLNDGTLDTGDIAPGATSRALAMPAGGTNYHCTQHTDMIGAVSPVSGGAPPRCDGPYCEG